jgi:hypothetical protein
MVTFSLSRLLVQSPLPLRVVDDQATPCRRRTYDIAVAIAVAESFPLLAAHKARMEALPAVAAHYAEN